MIILGSFFAIAPSHTYILWQHKQLFFYNFSSLNAFLRPDSKLGNYPNFYQSINSYLFYLLIRSRISIYLPHTITNNASNIDGYVRFAAVLAKRPCSETRPNADARL